MQSKIKCINPKCNADLKRPNVPFIKCPSCKTDFFVFCHEFPYRLFEYIKCRQCPRELYYFFCFKCSGLLSFNKYRMGSVSTCKCGFSGCYVVCNLCKRPECFPPDRRYQGVAWKCNHCKNPFNFMTCDRCFHEIYEKDFPEGKKLLCRNSACNANLVIKNCEVCKYIFADSYNKTKCQPCEVIPTQLIKQSVKQPPQDDNSSTKESKKSTSKGESVETVCKVCLDKQAQFINTQCYHLSVCVQCVKSMHNQCPICRAYGTFHKVFK